VGQVNVSHPTDNSIFDTYELSLSLEGGQITNEAGQIIMVSGIDTPEVYQALISRFAADVVERLD
jgi:hypothetical protein